MEVALRAYSCIYDKCPLSPNIMHERYYKAVAGKLDESLNPEIQLRGKNFGIEMPSLHPKISWKGKLAVYPEETHDIILKDIGRAWLKKSMYKKPTVKKSHFTSWNVKKNDKKGVI
jgi:hypothetical protein